MVCLHKYIISEESVFLLLQHAEGGKLWSYVSKFLDRSPDGSFALPEAGTPTQRKESPRPPACGAQGGGSLESRASEGGRAPLALPLRASLTPSSQDSVHDEDGHGSSPGWPDSGSGSEDECTTSYLTLCNEYGQEKVGPGSLDEELFIKPRGGEADPSAVGGPRAPLAAAGDSPCRRRRAQGPPGQGAPAALSPSRTSDSLSRSKNSPVELFRIDSKDSTREPLALDFGDRLSGLKAEPLTPLLPLPDSARAHRGPDGGQRGAGLAAQDSISGGSEDSVPVISFEEAAFGGAAGADEGRPDLLVNLPGELEAPRAGADMGPKALSPSQPGLAESKLLEVPDVLGLRLSPEQGQPPVGAVPEGPGDPAWPGAQSVAEKRSGQGPLGAFFIAAVDRGGSGDESPLRALGPELAGTVHSTGDSVDRIAPRLVGTDAWGAGADALSAEEVLLFTDHADDAAGQEPTLLPRGPRRWGESASALGGDREVHQVFEDLDRKLALSSRVSIPEGCIQRWAAEMVVALDALHREGIVCRDLNPDNILLNDRGHIQLTYFSRWSEVEDSCDTAAVERMYCAPEVGAITEETEACDWWSLGAVLFELLTGKTLVECHPAGINTHTTLNMPECVSEEARSLIQQLLQYNPVERLGAGVAGVEDIKSHPFFTPVDWAELTRCPAGGRCPTPCRSVEHRAARTWWGWRGKGRREHPFTGTGLPNADL
ncbi:Ribosomal protein S6 kinase delta-1 [Galemys pyrenaicus]|uniref:Ribosomal protein S6 kinase delta-1 n=1 Tax=Galemys pyrenaicus TaxID=202257 RepID=A0A8J6DFH8_GALPY|nr:Ribosomal protein S6 kinase delta-1 [Galemys pyrenaicus]